MVAEFFAKLLDNGGFSIAGRCYTQGQPARLQGVLQPGHEVVPVVVAALLLKRRCQCLHGVVLNINRLLVFMVASCCCRATLRYFYAYCA